MAKLDIGNDLHDPCQPSSSQQKVSVMRFTPAISRPGKDGADRRQQVYTPETSIALKPTSITQHKSRDFIAYKYPCKDWEPWFTQLQDEAFPWTKLPKELQIKVLKNLQRRDLCACKALSKHVCEMIVSNEKSMRRRHLDFVRIERIGQGRVQLSMRCDEEGKKMKWVACQKRKRRDTLQLSMQIKKAFVDFYRIATTGAPAGALNIEPPAETLEAGTSMELPATLVDRLLEVLKGSELDRLRFNEMELSDNALYQIGKCVRSTNCRVRLLSFELTSLSCVTPSVLLQFVRDVAPTDLIFRMVRGCTQEHFGPEMCRFIVSRRFFSVSELIDAQSNDVPLSLDDTILSELSASTFQLAVPSSITVDGLRSFIKAFATGKRSLDNASIKTSFPLRGIRFPFSAHAKILIEDEKTINIVSQPALQAVC